MTEQEVKKELKEVNSIIKQIRDERRKLLDEYRFYMNKKVNLKGLLPSQSA